MAFDKNNPNSKQAGAELGQAQPQLGLRLTNRVGQKYEKLYSNLAQMYSSVKFRA